MLIRNFNPKNYMMIKFRLQISPSIFSLARDLGITGICFIDGRKIMGILKKNEDEKRDFKMFLARTMDRETRDYYFVNLYENDNIGWVSEILKKPSFLVDYIYLENGYINFRVSYHQKFNREVSKVTPSLVENDVDIDYIGPYRNLRLDLNSISQVFNLRSILFRTEVPEEYIKTDRSAQIKWIRVVRTFSSKELESVYVIEDCNNPGGIFTPIDIDACIYEAQTENPLLLMEESEIKKTGIRPVSNVNHFDGKYLWIQYILMERDLTKFISTYGNILKMFPEWKGYIYEIENLETRA